MIEEVTENKIIDQEKTFEILNKWYLNKVTNKIDLNSINGDMIFNVIEYSEELCKKMLNNQMEPYAIAQEALFRQVNNIAGCVDSPESIITSDNVTIWLEKYGEGPATLAETVKYIKRHQELVQNTEKNTQSEIENGTERIYNIMDIAPKINPSKKAISSVEEYRHHAKKFYKDTDLQLPKIDEKIVATMLIQGYRTAETKKAIMEASPIAAINEKTYAQALVNQIAKRPEVKKAIKEKSKGICR